MPINSIKALSCLYIGCRKLRRNSIDDLPRLKELKPIRKRKRRLSKLTVSDISAPIGTMSTSVDTNAMRDSASLDETDQPVYADDEEEGDDCGDALPYILEKELEV